MLKELTELFFHVVGGLLIMIGCFGAWMNWKIVRQQIRFSRGEVERNSSMAPFIGFALPLGCLFFASLRVHFLWTWLLDPFSAWIILSGPFAIWKKLTRSRS